LGENLLFKCASQPEIAKNSLKPPLDDMHLHAQARRGEQLAQLLLGSGPAESRTRCRIHRPTTDRATKPPIKPSDGRGWLQCRARLNWNPRATIMAMLYIIAYKASLQWTMA